MANPTIGKSVIVTKDRVAEVLAQVKALTRDRVLVGVPADKAGRNEGEPITNPEIAYINDRGAPELNIPARPFMVPGVERELGRITKRMRSGAVRALNGDKDAAQQTFVAVGLIAQAAIRKRIDEGPFVPLSPVTLANRRARGRSGTKPLIDTGQLRNAITFVIRKRGGG